VQIWVQYDFRSNFLCEILVSHSSDNVSCHLVDGLPKDHS
jgi:hypothetical protein